VDLRVQGVQAGLDVLAWVTMAPKPAPYIKETIGSAQFYTNRVLKDFKDSEPKQADWAKAYVALLNGLYKYVKVLLWGFFFLFFLGVFFFFSFVSRWMLKVTSESCRNTT
jgi:hypothetical protein